MANKKMTKREMFEQIKANYKLTDAEVAFIDHELELLAKKNASDKKLTAQQVANEAIKQVIMQVLTKNGGLMTVTDIQKSSVELDFSNQKLSALLRQMKIDGLVEKVEDKRKTYFKAI